MNFLQIINLRYLSPNCATLNFLLIIIFDMQANHQLNGFFTGKGNYIWAPALTFAWQGLVQEIIKQPIQIRSQDKSALAITENYNCASFNSAIISPEFYYARAGFGNQAVRKINKEVSAKFPNKTTDKLQENLQDDSIISYAYFLKNMLFENPFNKTEVKFNNVLVPGFEAKGLLQTNQILVHEYQNENNFIIELKTTAENDHILVIKSEKQYEPQQIVEKSKTLKKAESQMRKSDTFRMPKVQLSQRRDVKELKGVFLANQKFKSYYFSQIYEIVKLDLSQTGVRVENEGVVIMTRGMAMKPVEVRSFIIDKPFWLVMREKDQHPYFVAHIDEVKDKQ